MAPTTSIASMGAHAGREVTLAGWLYNKRDSKKLVFLQIRDGSGICQAVVSRADAGDDAFERAAKLAQECSVRVTGTVVADARSKGGFELHAHKVELVHAPTEEYPISPKEHGVDFLMKRRHLWLRSTKQWATLRVRAAIIRAIREHLDGDGFTCVDAPIFTPSACEGTTTLFKVDYFGEPAFLSQSGQLYMEAAAMALGKVYCFGPAFRAEKSKTRRHLTEFWMVEPEIAYGTMEDSAALAQSLICHVVARVLATCARELEILERDTTGLAKIAAPFPRITYDEAIVTLKAAGHDIEWGGDFGAPDEAVLTAGRTQPLIVTGFPTAIKAFYMKPDPARPEVVLGYDILGPEGAGEIVGGGQRSDDLDHLLAQLAHHELPQQAFEWYLDLRRYGSVPHSGFGIGLERTVAWLCGSPHIRETIPFPRMLEHKEP